MYILGALRLALVEYILLNLQALQLCLPMVSLLHDKKTLSKLSCIMSEGHNILEMLHFFQG